MRLFQNGGLTKAYREILVQRSRPVESFTAKLEAFLYDRYAACHILKPVYDHEPAAFYTNGNDPDIQRAWASEHGLGRDTPLEAILQAQIEEHRTEVFYNLDPYTFGDEFLKRMPGCVKRTIAWRAAPSGMARFFNHDLVVNNFPHILDDYRRNGARTALFHPSHDPVMDQYSRRADRQIDVFFAGGFSRHHQTRNALLGQAAKLSNRFNVVCCLDVSRFTRLAETPLGLVPPLRAHRRPSAIRSISRAPVYGRELYELLGNSKLVLNAAVDMAGPDRGNMRVWEATGAGAALVSDAGNYPPGFEPQRNFIMYADADDLIRKVEAALQDNSLWSQVATAGNSLVRTKYSKDEQWTNFTRLVS